MTKLQMIFLGELGPGELSLLLLLLIPYFIPTFIAFAKDRRSKVAIFVLNLLLGWTLLIWIVCLVWACISDREPQNIYINNNSAMDNSEKEVVPVGQETKNITPKYDQKLENLKQLKALLDSGILTEEEFAIEKRKILALFD